MPQLYAICATESPVAVVFAHQGPWFHLARWDLRTGTLTRGAWLRGRIYQRRCDLSPDGTLLSCFAMKSGRAFHAVSKVPWLTALAFWGDDSTYSRGWHFEPVGRRAEPARDPDEGSIAPLATKHRLRLVANGPEPYAVELRRGWTRHADAPRRPAKDIWHEQTPQWLVRKRPGGDQRLELRDDGYVRGRLEGRAPRYALDGEPLPEVVWADWDTRGRLLVATRAGGLEIRTSTNKPTRATNLGDWTPKPVPAPTAARGW